MPQPTKGPRLGGGPAHERLLLGNLATSLFAHGRIETTEAKAKRLRPLAERLITFAKRGDLHARRKVMTIIKDKSVVHTLFTEIAPQLEGRDGGYTRIIKTGYRKGDNAPMAVIELVLEPVTKKASKSAGAGKGSKAKATEPVAEAAAEAESITEAEAEETIAAAEDAAENEIESNEIASAEAAADDEVADARADEAAADDAEVEGESK